MYRIAASFALIIAAAISGPVTRADVAPDPGFKRISLKLVVRTDEDLVAHRFFVVSGDQVREIELGRGANAVIGPLGGGARYSVGTLVAIPRSSLAGSAVDETNGGQNALDSAILESRIPGMIELVKHTFWREVSILETNWQDPVYRIETDNQSGLRAIHLSGGADLGISGGRESSGLRFWRSAAAAIVAGIFLAVGLAALGIWYFNRSQRTL